MTVIRVVVLALLLVASIAGAWGYARSLRRAGVRRGTDLIAQIREQGVANLYDGASERWYVFEALGRTTRQPVGWRIVMVEPRPDGWVHGLDFYVFPFSDGERLGAWERWQLNADATEGRYIAGWLGIESDQWIVAKDTVIELADGIVTAEQTIDDKVFRSRSEIPDNYVPEGAFELVLRLMLHQTDPTSMQLILNGQPPVNGRPDFQPLTLRHDRWERSRRSTVEAAIQVSVAGHDAEVVLLDQHGRIDSKLLQYGGAVLEETQSPAMAVQSMFRDALDVRHTVLAVVESQWRASAPPAEPSEPPVEAPDAPEP